MTVWIQRVLNEAARGRIYIFGRGDEWLENRAAGAGPKVWIIRARVGAAIEAVWVCRIEASIATLNRIDRIEQVARDVVDRVTTPTVSKVRTLRRSADQAGGRSRGRRG